MGLTIALPPRPHPEQLAFNLQRWGELCADPELAKLDHRIETDRYGHIIMTPPPAPNHGILQMEIGIQLRKRLGSGQVISECPVSTSDGVKGVDVAWISVARFAPMSTKLCLTAAPEICVEVLSPSNSTAEMDEKKALYFEAGAEEVWICHENGVMTFFSEKGPIELSAICATFPRQIELP